MEERFFSYANMHVFVYPNCENNANAKVHPESNVLFSKWKLPESLRSRSTINAASDKYNDLTDHIMW